MHWLAGLRRQALWGALTVALGMPSAYAQVHPDGSTAMHMDAAANGVPVVNIAAPNAAGLSHNRYQQFDVDGRGLILNNSGAISNTRLAGYIAGNANLGSGPAAGLILNEVTSTLPSQLNGVTEVAGQAAQVIIANPNGISCTGCGFINASRGVLTTGTPVIAADGSLQALRVSGGSIAINGQGLDGSQIDRVDLLARSVAINAGVWARQLNVVTGANQVDYASLATQQIAGSGITPGTALDVAAIGGMYAGAIRLIGTEAGLGVNSQGQIAAQSGNLTLTAAGQVVLAGKTSASGELTVQAAQDVSTAGTLAAGGALSLQSAAGITLAGTTYSGAGMVLSAANGLANLGQLQSQGSLQLGSGGAFANASGAGLYSAGPLSLQAAAASNAGRLESAQGMAVTVAGDLTNSGVWQADAGSLVVGSASLTNHGTLSASGDLRLDQQQSLNTDGQLLAGGALVLDAAGIGNAGTVQAGQGLQINAGDLSNQGRLYALGGSWSALVRDGLTNAAGADIYGAAGVSAQAGWLSNGGTIEARQSLQLAAQGALANQGSVQADGGDLTLDAATLSNTGALSAAGNGWLSIAGSLGNGGSVTANGDVHLQGGSILQQGAVQAGRSLSVNAASLDNRGKLYALAGPLTLQVQGALDNGAQGDIYSAAGLGAQLGSLSNLGAIESQQALQLHAAQGLDNRASIQSDGADLQLAGDAFLSNAGQLSARGNLTLSGGASLSNAGTAVAGGALTAQASALANQGVLQADGSLSLQGGSLDNRGKLYALGGDWTAQLSGGLFNQAGDIYGKGGLSASAAQLANSGSIEAGQGATFTIGGALGNSGSLLADGADLQIHAGSLDNQGAASAAGNLGVQTSGQLSSSGQLLANGDVLLGAGGMTTSGIVQAGHGLTLASGAVLANSGKLYALGGNWSAQLSGDLDTAAGSDIYSAGALQLQAHSASLTGTVEARQGAELTLGGELQNAGTLQTDGNDLRVTAGSFGNQGTLSAAGQLLLSLSGKASNQGLMVAGQTLQLVADRFDNAANGQLQSGTGLSLRLNGLDNQGSIYAKGDAQVDAAELTNGERAQLLADGTLTMGPVGTLSNEGVLQAGSDLSLTSAGALDNGAAASIYAGRGLSLGVTGQLYNLGSLYAGAGAHLAAGSVQNAGSIRSAGTLGLDSVGQLASQGLIQSGQGLSLSAGSMANDGKLYAVAGPMDLRAGGAFQSSATGDIYAGSDIALHADTVSNAGLLEAVGSLTFEAAGQASNRGSIQADKGGLNWSAGSLLNQGLLSAAGAISLGVGGSLQNQGTLVGGQTIALQATELDNSGQLQSAGNTTVQAASLFNSGRLQAGGDLSIQHNLDITNASAGQVLAAGSIQADTQGQLDNAGVLQAGGLLALLQAAGLSNYQGATVYAGGLGTLSFSGAVDNQGTLYAAHGLSLSTAGLSNGGSLRSGGDLSVSSSGDASNGGDSYAQGRSSWQVAGRLSNAGVLAAAGDTQVQAAALDGAGVLAAGLDATGALGSQGDLGVVTTGQAAVHGRALAGGQLSLTGAGLDLSGGQLRAGTDATLHAGNGQIDNRGGDLAANGTLYLQGASLLNGGAASSNGGRISAGTLALQLASLDNHYGQLTQTGTAALSLSFAGGFSNAYGSVASNADALTVQAASLDNSHGSIQSAGQGLLTLTSQGDLLNDGGQIASNGGLLARAGGTLDNRGGQLGIGGDIGLTAGTLDNGSGSLIGQNVSLALGQALLNAAGTVQAAGGLTSHSATLDNSGGYLKVTGNQSLSVTTTAGLLNGAGGFIGGNGQLAIQAGSLSNAGQIYAGDALTLVSQGDLLNDGGALQAMGMLQATASGALSNRVGRIEAGAGQAAASMSLTADRLDNTAGRIANAATGLSRFTTAGALTNQGGTLGGQGDVALTGGSLDNSLGGQLVAGNDLDLNLAGWNNAGGTAYAARYLHWTNAAAGLANASGKLSAGGDLQLTLASIDNGAGELAANGNVDLGLGSLSGGGSIAAGQDLTLALAGGLSTGGGTALSANRDLTLNLGGDFSNAAGASLQAVRNLTVHAGNIDNAAGALLNSAGTTLDARGTLSNQGRIEGDSITLGAQTINNTATIIGGSLTATAANFTNGVDFGSSTGNAAYQSALIATTDALSLYVSGNLVNRDATLFTLGGLTLAADAQHNRSASILNDSGDIEADGSIYLAANQFTNRRRVFETQDVALDAASNTVVGAAVKRYRYDDSDPNHQAPNVDASQIVGQGELAQASAYCGANAQENTQRCVGEGNPVSFQSVSTDVAQSQSLITRTSAQGQLLAGGDITIAGSVLNDKSTVAAGHNLTINGQDGNGGGGTTGSETVSNIAWSSTVQVGRRSDEQVEFQHLQHNPRTWIGGDFQIYGSSQSGYQLSLADAQQLFGGLLATASAGATMSAGNNVDITAHTIDNTAVDSNGQPVKSAIGLGSNAGGQGVSGQAAGGVAHAGAGGAAVGAVALGQAPGATQGGSLSVAQGRGGVDSGAAPGAASQGGAGTPGSSAPDAVAAVGGSAPGAAAAVAGGSGKTGSAPAAPQVVATLVGPNASVSLPQSGLYTVSSNPSSPYLVETDPRFTSYTQFVSSDYMLDKLNLDPSTTTKRLGDGFYEERQVLDQITQLTGRRYLDDNSSALDQYRALMDAGVSQASQFNLAVGVALTAEQMASLTQDMVWMVNETVDGQQVLVPVVYLSAEHARELAQGGATIAGKNVTLTASGDITNNGTISASQNATLTASNLLNSGNVSAGGNLSINAAQDILNGGKLSAGGNVSLVAGNDVRSGVDVAQQLGAINLGSLSAPVSMVALSGSLPGAISAGGSLSLSAGRDLSLDAAPIKAGTDLSLAAGRDLTATASAISAGGNAQLVAGRDLGLEATAHTVGQGALQNGSESTTHTVSTVSAGGTLLVAAGRDLGSQGAQLGAGGTLVASAGRDLTLVSVTDTARTATQGIHGQTVVTTQTMDQSVRGSTLNGSSGVAVAAGHDASLIASTVSSDKGGISLTAGHDVTLGAASEQHDWSQDSKKSSGGLLSSTTTKTHDATSDSYAVGSTLSGDTVAIGAGHDLSATAAQIAGTHDVTLAAGNNLSLTNGVDTHSESHDKTVSKSGLMGDGIGVMIGASKQSQSYDLTQTSAVGSLVGSTDGKVTLSAGNDLHITGSDVISQTGTAIVGNTVTIDAAVGTTDATQTFKQQSAGIHLGVAGGAASVAQAVYGAQQSASRSDDSRVKALYAAQAAQALYSKGAGNAMGLGDQTGAQAVGQAAGGSTQGMSLRIGIGASSASSTTKTHDDTAYGSHISSAGDITIAATGGDLNVIGSQISGDNVALAAANNLNLLSQAEQHTDTNHSKNGSGEVGFSVGSQTGFYVTASMGKGEAHGNGTTHLDSSVSASNTLSLISGNDTTIQGAQASGNTVLASIGGNLNLASEQDTDDYAAKQWQVGGTFVYGSGGGFNLSAGKTDSHYASVTQTSGISAGTGGYQIAVGGNTDLKGAVIASTADPSRNLLNTGSLSYSDIANQASYSAASVSLGTGVKGLMPGLSVPQGKDSHSTTQAAVSAGSIVVRDYPGQDLSGLSRDASLADSHALTNRFDPTKLADQQLAGQLAGQVLMTGAGDLEQSHQWATGSNQATALHTAAGALAAGLGGGNVLGGALGAGAGEAAIPWLEKSFGTTGISLGSTLVGGLVGGDSGAAAANAGVNYNYLNHQQRQQKADELARCGGDASCQQQTEIKWDTVDQSQGAAMAQQLIALGGLSAELQEQLQDTNPASPAYAGLLSQAIVQSAQINPVMSLTMGMYLSLANEYDGNPRLSPYASGVTQSQLNAVSGAVLGPLFGFAGNFTLAVGGTPQQVAAGYEAGGIVFGMAVGGKELTPGKTVAEPVDTLLPDPYAGVKEASAYLKSMGVDRATRVQILQSFDISTLSVEQAGDNLFGLRFHDFGETAKPEGQYLFETFGPQTDRAGLALPYKWNGMTGIQQWQVVPGTTYLRGITAPQFEFGAQYTGGAEQMFVLKPWQYGTLR